MVGEGGASPDLGNMLSRKSGVAGAKLIYGRSPCKVLGLRRTVSRSFVETARVRLMFCCTSKAGLIMLGDFPDETDATSNGGRGAGSEVVDMKSCCCTVVYVGSSE